MSKYSIIKIIPYFGQWPEWINLYIESCKHNADIDWLFYTDCPLPDNRAENVRYVQLTFSEYKQLVGERLAIKFNARNPYKLCDVKPAYGYIHQSDIQKYDFFAFGDIDIIYGHIRTFITDGMLNKYNVISTQNRRLSGHFSLIRNTEQNRNAFRQIPDWQALMETEEHLGIDESNFSKLFVRHKNHPLWLRKIWSLSSPYQRRVLFKEQYSTILSPFLWCDGSPDHPQTWFWRGGKLTNDRDDREFMYLHFMNWKSNRWLPKTMRNQPAAWMTLDKLVQIDFHEAGAQGFQISPAGFTAIGSG